MFMKNEKFITYALDSKNHIVHVDKVPNGLACNCHCPKCNELLVAKNNGKVKKHHFAHQSNTDCKYAYETTLHLLAKNIIKDTKLIPTINPDGTISMEIADTIELEKRIGDIVPDIYACINGKNIAIEIYVTHKIDDVKYGKIQEYGLTTFEVDLSKIEVMDAEYIKNLLISHCTFRLIHDNDIASNLVNQKKNFILKNGIFKPIENGIVKNCPMSLILIGRKITTRKVRVSLCNMCFCSLQSEQENGVYCVGHFDRLPNRILSIDIHSNRILSESEVKEKIMHFKRNIESSSL